jgi:hypothetical protein
MLSILNAGGLTTGGVNFDAKVRRESFEPIDLFYAHIGGMDAFARGLKIAAAIRKDGRLAEFVRQRYSSWDSGIGKEIESGKSNFEALEKYMLKKGEPAANTSGRQEFLENLINEFICQGQQGQRQRRAGKDDQPPVNPNRVDLLRAAGDQRTEAGLRRLDAQSQITQKTIRKE